MSTYRVALCEDEAAERRQMAGLCREILAAWGTAAEVVPFPCAEELLQAPEADRDAFDLYLLDIQMGRGISGMDLARRLYRRGVRNRIIFITGNPDYALEGYDVEPLHYLLKPVGREQLAVALRRAVERQEPRTALFQRDGKPVALPLREIRYLESRYYGVVVHLEGGERSFAIPLTEAERLVPAWMFQRCHKSYLVNLGRVERATHAGVQLEDGESLPMSRTYYAAFQNALIRRLNRQG